MASSAATATSSAWSANPLSRLAGWHDFRGWTGRAKWLNILINLPARHGPEPPAIDRGGLRGLGAPEEAQITS